MSDQKTTETVRAVDKTASTGGSKVDKKADTARTVTSAGADVAQRVRSGFRDRRTTCRK